MQDPPDVSKGGLDQFLGDDTDSWPLSPCDSAGDFPYGLPDEEPPPYFEEPVFPTWGRAVHVLKALNRKPEWRQEDRPEFIWGYGRAPAGLSASAILAKLCECSTVLGGCGYHPWRDGMTDAQALAEILTPGDTGRYALEQLGLTPDLVALVLRDEWTPYPRDRAHWDRLLNDPPTLLRV